MKKFEIIHSDGTIVIIKAMSEDMARQFAMTNKYGKPGDNRTWFCSYWTGAGLSVKELVDAD